MSLWNEYLVRKLIFENHPAPDEERCLNRRQAKDPCTRCMDVCPEHVFPEPLCRDAVPDWTACSGCGLCAATCPSRAIAPSRLYAEKFLQTASHHFHDITITCKNDTSADVYSEFPGSIPWELLCFFTLESRVIMIVGDCRRCANTSCRQLLHENVAKVLSFWGAENGSSEHIIVTPDPASVPPRRYTRREALLNAVKRTGRTAAVLLPLPEETVPDGMLWKKLLLHRIGQLQVSVPDGLSRTAFFWDLPSFTDQCTACGICTRICPSQALLRSPGPEGSGRFYMALLPAKCTGCGLCAAVCPEKGIAAPAAPPSECHSTAPSAHHSALCLEDPSRPILHAVSAVPCPRCKEPVPTGSGSSLCARCRGEIGHLR